PCQPDDPGRGALLVLEHGRARPDPAHLAFVGSGAKLDLVPRSVLQCRTHSSLDPLAVVGMDQLEILVAVRGLRPAWKPMQRAEVVRPRDDVRGDVPVPATRLRAFERLAQQ